MSDSVEKIREQAETFVNRGKDAWNLHYAETETALRQRSDESLQHLTGFQVCGSPKTPFNKKIIIDYISSSLTIPNVSRVKLNSSR